MGNNVNKGIPDIDLSKFNLADMNKDSIISMEEFEFIYVSKTGQRPSWQDWYKFMLCDVHKTFTISRNEFINFKLEDNE